MSQFQLYLHKKPEPNREVLFYLPSSEMRLLACSDNTNAVRRLYFGVQFNFSGSYFINFGKVLSSVRKNASVHKLFFFLFIEWNNFSMKKNWRGLYEWVQNVISDYEENWSVLFQGNIWFVFEKCKLFLFLLDSVVFQSSFLHLLKFLWAFSKRHFLEGSGKTYQTQ